jgi:recombination protein RecA
MELDSIGIIRKALSVSDAQFRIPTIPTGLLTLDLMVGGGFPLGRTTSIAGLGGCGKTTLVWTFLDNVAKLGGVPVLIDTEYYYTEQRVQELGLTHLAERIILKHELTTGTLFTQFKEILETIASVKGYRFGFIVIDSWSDTPSVEEMTSGKPGVGIHAKSARHFFRSALHWMVRFNIGVIFVCQSTKRISTMPGFKGGSTYLSHDAIFANSFLEIQMARIKNMKKGGATVGFQTKVDIKKNKLAPPFQELTLDYYFHLGYDRARSVLNALVNLGLSSHSKGWYAIPGTEEKIQAAQLRNNLKLFDALETLAYEEGMKASTVEIKDVIDGEDLSAPDADIEVEDYTPEEGV